MSRDLWRWSYSLSTLFPIVGSFIVTPTLTRMLSPHDYGLVAVAALTVQVGGLVLALGLSSRIILTSVRCGGQHARGLTVWAVATGVFLAVAGQVLLWPFRREFDWLPASIVAFYGAGISAGISNLLSLLRSLKIPQPYVWVSAVTSVVAPLCGLGIMRLLHGSWLQYLLGLYCITTVALLGGLWCSRGDVTFAWGEIGRSLSVSLPLLPHQVSLAVFPLIVVTLAVEKESVATAGSLQLGLYLASTVGLAVSALNATWSPAVLGVKPAERPDVARMWWRRVVWIVVCLYVLLAWFSPLATWVLAPASYDRHLIARTAIVAGFAGVMSAFLNAESHFLLARDRTRSLAVVSPIVMGGAFLVVSRSWGCSAYLPGIGLAVSFLLIAVWIKLMNVADCDSHIPWKWYGFPTLVALGSGVTAFILEPRASRLEWQLAGLVFMLVLLGVALVFRARIVTLASREGSRISK